MNKEEIYDSQINPLMAKIIDICKDNGISFLATFSLPTPDDDSLACTSFLPDENDELPEHIAQMRDIIFPPTNMFRIKSVDGNGKVVTDCISVVGS